MSVVGFDIGNDTCVVAAAKQRGIDVLLNDECKRETPSAVAFAEKQRLLGSAAAASAAMVPRSTITQVKRLLGRPFAAPDVQSDLRRLPFPASAAPDGGVVVQLRYLGQDRTFTPVQILAMLLSHLKHLAEKSLETSVSDCVIGVPSYFTDAQRRAYLDAASIAGLKPLRLMHDVAATALGYGIYKTDLPAHVAFVDIGHCDTQVSVVAFESGQMRVLSHACDANLGGRDFDEVLYNHFVEQFKEQYKIDVASSVRASIRLRMACEKLKKVLSANLEAPISIECLMDEKDVKGYMKREEFERLCSDLLDRVLEPCKKALMDSGLSVDRIQSVELVGSGSRIPAVMKILAGFFRKEPSRTLNASECVARGCAVQCAMLSPAFRVREYEVQDSLPFSIGIASDDGPINTMSSNVLFRKGQPIPSLKMLTLHRSSAFNLEAFYTNQNELPPGVSPKISSFQIGPFQVAGSEKSKVKVRVRLNLHGIVSVESASLFEDDINDPVTREGTSMDHMDTEFAASSRSYVMSDNIENGVSPDPGSAAVKRERNTRRHDLPVKETFNGGMTKAELQEAQEQEQQLAYQDRLMEQTKERKNALESYVYEIRNKLFERYRSFASDSERESISTNLQQTEEWLYEDGDDEIEKVYSSKLEELKKLVDPIENRYKDEEVRAQATRELLKCIVDHRMAVRSLATYERDAIFNECNKAEQWLREKSQQQDSLPKSADPVLWSHEIKKVTEELNIACRNIMRHKGSPARSEDTRGSDPSNTPDRIHTD
ncbi:heat shock 70 kDa protein 16-like [Ananas comosus]|uniref:Heat shock 70 kDa protein 16-like n=1 Tax=Ananas comosus TaxID=4615 RepID=A0A6P5EA39_ANACO|nr:heat shock 70 kDa protein 16-like [Ananas comosus]XP_020100802.1 heat shock 70 kDa protein 16-like [Ananas comosus]